MSNFAIPGFMTPSTPADDQRIRAKLDGTIVWDIMQVADDRSLPLFELSVAQDHGANHIRRIIIDPKQISMVNVASPTGQRIIRATFPSTCLAIGPGTYRLQAFRDNLLQAEKYVTIEPSVINAEQLACDVFQDCPKTFKPDTST